MRQAGSLLATMLLARCFSLARSKRASPSPRKIRSLAEVDYEALSEEAQAALAEYNERYAGVTLGIGSRDPPTGIWNPLLPVIADKH